MIQSFIFIVLMPRKESKKNHSTTRGLDRGFETHPILPLNQNTKIEKTQHNKGIRSGIQNSPDSAIEPKPQNRKSPPCTAVCCCCCPCGLVNLLCPERAFWVRRLGRVDKEHQVWSLGLVLGLSQPGRWKAASMKRNSPSVSQARTETEGKVAGCYRRRRRCLGCFGAINTTSSGAFYKFCPLCVF
jgi:hypothetical protein